MKNYKMVLVLLLQLSLIVACKTPSNGTIDNKMEGLIKADNLNIICIRHAEKEADSKNPFLTEAGKERAKDFTNLLDGISVDAIYSSEFNRTLGTVLPLSQNRQIATKLYDPRNLTELKKNLLSNHKKQTVVVVGHSNSTPQFANLLLGKETYSQFDESDYDNLIIVSIDENGVVESQIMQYGKETIVE